LGLVCLYLKANVAEAGKFEYVMWFFGPWEGYKEQGQGNGIRTIRGQTSGKYLFDAYGVKTRSTNPSDMSFAGVLLA
jgi:hypothetical protein